jgi:hypothetical protein
MKLSKIQYDKLPVELQEYFEPIGGGDGVSRNAHPT